MTKAVDYLIELRNLVKFFINFFFFFFFSLSILYLNNEFYYKILKLIYIK